MASECAILGTPSIYVNSLSAGILEEHKQQNLIHMFNSTDGIIEKAQEILEDDHYKVRLKSIRDKALQN